MAKDLTVLAFVLVIISHTVSDVIHDYCPLGSIVTSNACGQLGNVVWDYAGICAVAEILQGNYLPYMRKYHEHFIKSLFEGPYLPILEDIPLNCSCCLETDWTKETMGDVTVRQLIEWNKTENIVIHSPGVLDQPVLHKLEYIKNRLQYKKKYIQAANNVFNNVSSQFISRSNLTNQRLTFVGVHVRRSDYLQYLPVEKQAGITFFNFAFDYFRNKKNLSKCVFLVVSDDPVWVKDNLTSNKTNADVFLVSNGEKYNPSYDLTLLSLCNHTIYDYGSFGLWGAVYAGGEVVTTSSYGKANTFIRRTKFHFFDSLPKEELSSLDGFEKDH